MLLLESLQLPFVRLPVDWQELDYTRHIGGMRAGSSKTLTFQAGCPEMRGSESTKLIAIPSALFNFHRGEKTVESVARPRSLISCVPKSEIE